MERKPPSDRKPRTPKSDGETPPTKPYGTRTSSSYKPPEVGAAGYKPSAPYRRPSTRDGESQFTKPSTTSEAGSQSQTPKFGSQSRRPPFRDGERPPFRDGERPPFRKPYTGAPRFDHKKGPKPGDPHKIGKPGKKNIAKSGTGANVPSQVKELMKQHNLSARSAFRVSKGLWTVEQAVADDTQRTERRCKAEEMAKQYPGINISLACYLLKSDITPEKFLELRRERELRHQTRRSQQKQKMGEDTNQKIAFDTMARFCEQKTELELAKYGQQFQSGILQEFTPYEFIFISGTLLSELHRLKLKYFYEKRYSDVVKKWIMVDKSILKRRLRPAYRPTNRYTFPEGILQKNAEIMLALHEGEMIRGKVIWFTPYDILLQANKAEIWVFRHSIVECALIKKP